MNSCDMSGGGGGGYYGGGSDACCGSGGGGSSYSSGTNTAHTQGYQAGNGYVMISVTGCSSASASASGASCPSFSAPTANPTPSPTLSPTPSPTLGPTAGFNAVYLATFGDNSNRAMTLVNGGAHSYSWASCAQYAHLNGYIYFALQDGSAPSNAQCLVSNTILQVTQYGTTTNGAGTVTYTTSSVDGKVYGGGWANAVYMVRELNEIPISTSSN